MLAYLARYTHRVAISNSRLIALDEAGVTFKWKDYRIKGRDRLKTMTLAAAEFIRRFLLHVLPSGFHRIRHYGLFASAVRAAKHRARAPAARQARGRARTRARRGRQRRRKSRACAAMPLLRRPHDHHRNLRRRAPRAFANAEPDQDRHLMIAAAALPASLCRSPSLRRRAEPSGAVSPDRAPSSAPPRRQRPLVPRSTSRVALAPTARTRAPPAALAPCATLQPPSNPHRPRPAETAPLPARGFVLGRLSNAGPASKPRRRSKGRRPKPFTIVAGPRCSGREPAVRSRLPVLLGGRERGRGRKGFW